LTLIPFDPSPVPSSSFWSTDNDPAVVDVWPLTPEKLKL
jgi:hypothetical protein